jgi:hypothetical protein
MAQNIVDLFEDKARAGDAAYAIAFALMQLAEAQERVAKKVGHLGFDAPGGRDPGALEYIGVQLSKIAGALDHLSISASVDLNDA